MLLRGEAQAIGQALHLKAGLFDTAENLQFLLVFQQWHSADQLHVSLDRVIEGLILAVLRQLHLFGLRGFGFGANGNLDTTVVQLQVKLVQGVS